MSVAVHEIEKFVVFFAIHKLSTVLGSPVLATGPWHVGSHLTLVETVHSYLVEGPESQVG
jgi:hypothetical protein